ncbi:hypothetical protein QVA66_03680 [Staphylococcus chromogenes]|nr:hypothetical protein [Staphylococcus chromogenes]
MGSFRRSLTTPIAAILFTSSALSGCSLFGDSETSSVQGQQDSGSEQEKQPTKNYASAEELEKIKGELEAELRQKFPQATKIQLTPRVAEHISLLTVRVESEEKLTREQYRDKLALFTQAYEAKVGDKAKVLPTFKANVGKISVWTEGVSVDEFYAKSKGLELTEDTITKAAYTHSPSDEKPTARYHLKYPRKPGVSIREALQCEQETKAVVQRFDQHLKGLDNSGDWLYEATPYKCPQAKGIFDATTSNKDKLPELLVQLLELTSRTSKLSESFVYTIKDDVLEVRELNGKKPTQEEIATVWPGKIHIIETPHKP